MAEKGGGEKALDFATHDKPFRLCYFVVTKETRYGDACPSITTSYT